MFGKGKRGLVAGSCLLLLIAVAHTLGMSGGAENVQQAAVMGLMRTVKVMESGPFRPTFWMLVQNLGYFMSLALVFLGALGLMVARALPAGHGLLRQVAAGLGLLCVLSAALAAWTQLPPPLLSFALAAPCFFASAWGGKG